MSVDWIADYRRRGWALVPVPAGQKPPVIKDWQNSTFGPADFPAGGNLGLIAGPKSGEIVDIDLDCAEALALADLYLPPTGAIFGRASKPRSHRLYVAPSAVFAAFADPLAAKDEKATLLELRARDATGGEHQTLIPPSTVDGERREWEREAIEPAPYDAAKLHRRCAYLAVACLVRRYVSEYASERPAPDLPHLLYAEDPVLGRAAYRWLGIPDPYAPPRPQRSSYTRAEIDLAKLVDAIPNDCDWHGWNRIGMAIFAASGGSNVGGDIFDRWSAKHAKYNPYTTVERWQNYRRSPPSQLSLGTLIHLARQAGWQPPRETA